MNKLTITSINLIRCTVFSFLVLGVVAITSCGDDAPESISGCTNANADNYNSSATTDNGSCTFVNRFLGNWEGDFSCTGALGSVFTDAQLTIVSIAGVTDSVQAFVNSSTNPAGVPIPVNGGITENTLTISQSLSGQPVAIKPGLMGQLWDIKVNGTFSLSADGTTLSGPITFDMTETGVTNQTILETCPFTAMKQ